MIDYQIWLVEFYLRVQNNPMAEELHQEAQKKLNELNI